MMIQLLRQPCPRSAQTEVMAAQKDSDMSVTSSKKIRGLSNLHAGQDDFHKVETKEILVPLILYAFTSSVFIVRKV